MTERMPKLSALTTAALALPGVAQAEVETDYLYARYDEADIPADRSASGRAAERYTIDSHLIRVAAPLWSGQAEVNLTVESMSGASPWWVQPDADGKPVQVMSGASIDEERIDIEASYGRNLGEIDGVLRVGYSSEDDYRAVNGGVEAQYTLSGKAYSLSAGLGYSDDTLEPTDAGNPAYPGRVSSADRRSATAYAGLSWILNPQSVVQASLAYGWHDGFLSDPYKRAYVQSITGTVLESRPDGRQSLTASLRWRRYLPEWSAAVHVDYRYFQDDWEIESHTLELAWQQRLGERWRLSPALRWYSQSQAYFYAPFYADFRNDGFASSDYRLSPFGALSARLDLRYAVAPRWEIGGGVEVYDAAGDYALREVKVENPGLVEYTALQLRVSYRY